MTNEYQFDYPPMGEEDAKRLRDVLSSDDFSTAHVASLHLHVSKIRDNGVHEQASESCWAHSCRHLISMLQKYHPYDSVESSFTKKMIPVFYRSASGEVCIHLVVPLPREIPVSGYGKFLQEAWAATLWGKSASELKPLKIAN